MVGSTFAMDADFILHRNPGSPRALPEGMHGLSCAGQLRKENARGPLDTVFMLKPAWPKGEACELNFGAAQVIMRKGVSKGTNTPCCHPVSPSLPVTKTVLPPSWIQRREGYF